MIAGTRNGGCGCVRVDRLLDEYVEYQRKYKSLAENSVLRHQRYARLFLDHFLQGERMCSPALVNVESIQAYAMEYAHGHGREASRIMFSTLRELLRFLHLEGYLPHDLSEAAPTLHRRQLSQVPRCISEEHIESLLNSIDRSQGIGKRDYAMIQILSTYGVRGAHVRELKLEDVQWMSNRIVFKPVKGGKRIVQHLTPAVGNSLLDYLRHARPHRTLYREVFLTCKGMPRPLRLPATLSIVISNRLKAAGINLPAGTSRGSHPFRHYAEFRIMPSRLLRAA